MATTIQISEELKNELSDKKLSESETYEEVIWDIIEDTMALDEETKKEINLARKEIREGKYATISRVKKELGL